eukprot:365640-Chlamydomonas_euryale.AAC.3
MAPREGVIVAGQLPPQLLLPSRRRPGLLVTIAEACLKPTGSSAGDTDSRSRVPASAAGAIATTAWWRGAWRGLASAAIGRAAPVATVAEHDDEDASEEELQALRGECAANGRICRDACPATMDHALWTMHHAPCTMHHAPCTMHHAPCTMRHAPSTMHHAPCTKHHAPCTVHHAQSTIHHAAHALCSLNCKGAWSPPLRLTCQVLPRMKHAAGAPPPSMCPHVLTAWHTVAGASGLRQQGPW